MHERSPAEVRDTSRWILASFEDISRKTYASTAWKDFENFENDHLFQNKAAYRAFKEFLKHGGCRLADTSLSALIGPDTMLTDAIDLFCSIIQSYQSSQRSLLPSSDPYTEVEQKFKMK